MDEATARRELLGLARTMVIHGPAVRQRATADQWERYNALKDRLDAIQAEKMARWIENVAEDSRATRTANEAMVTAIQEMVTLNKSVAADEDS
jgi:hypothetical protein